MLGLMVDYVGCFWPLNSPASTQLDGGDLRSANSTSVLGALGSVREVFPTTENYMGLLICTDVGSISSLTRSVYIVQSRYRTMGGK
ncbi:hypothetical protein VN97_g6434 [Penicillium thymicola]|uniref:Uncharacterized protein n=1 Tax=Penicillium thymicola TaxID=293382 RepID=A0AAI9X8A9_PENTH|nr:hypothetical protein VN97_g6434 [Penicillium thymicola]